MSVLSRHFRLMSDRQLAPVDAQRWMGALYQIGFFPRGSDEELEALADKVEPHMVAITEAIREFNSRAPEPPSDRTKG